MRKITKRFCGNNPILLSYFRESRRYSPIDIRIRKTALQLLNTTRSILVYFQNFQLSHLQAWIEENISITLLYEIPSPRRRKLSENIFLYQI
jgi:hypothetical protein